jgi:hypothetical protein
VLSIQRLIKDFQDSLEPFAVFPDGSLENILLFFVDLEPKVQVLIPMYDPLEVTKCEKWGTIMKKLTGIH